MVRRAAMVVGRRQRLRVVAADVGEVVMGDARRVLWMMVVAEEEGLVDDNVQIEHQHLPTFDWA
jgi:hypothetical protein